MKIFTTLLLLIIFVLTGFSQNAKREFYQLRIYHFSSAQQEKRADNYFTNALIPALHRSGIKLVGAFKPGGNDTSADRRIILLIPFKSLDQVANLQSLLIKNKKYLLDSEEYMASPHNDPPFNRMESIILQAFTHMPSMRRPSLNSKQSDKVYELRSYESASENLYRNKVRMFNEGGEVKLFERLGFNAVFYGEVISGSRMPNLMYMTSFENKASRDAHWKTFSADPEWKILSSKPEYKNNVSKIDILFLQATEYSDL